MTFSQSLRCSWGGGGRCVAECLILKARQRPSEIDMVPSMSPEFKIASTLDEEPERLFPQSREERGLTLSRALHVAIWNFLGKPPMSFEQSKLKESMHG